MNETDESIHEQVSDDPFCANLGIDIAEVSPGFAKTTLSVEDQHLNFHGTLYGGAIYVLADAAFAAASNSHGETAVGLESNISYLQAAAVGDKLVATAKETYAGKKTAEYEVTITDGSDERIATFRGRVYKT
ncbi:acyl-CoA thioesterase [Halogranum amylolyticum]|uniref:Acyl-CoA thioesterase n=1 Tax=Halogranum amylolyticum TaxID=660520 RepID=A0A1H8WRI1_9EURY|nr:hotdog fold thioesterase [Halogranum amylolyticum]SEP30037.1 acyl-CoA thioesterase [Halogranum amylolyticum]